MKVCIIQPAYCTDHSLSDEYFQRELGYLDQCDESMDLIDKYDCRRYVYFMSGNDNVLKLAKELAPDICRCCGAGDDP